MSKVVIITGAGKKLGKAFAIGLSRSGYDVVITGRNQTELDEVAGRLNGEYMTQVCDITSIEDCASLVAAVKEKFGSIDVLINNAGVYVESSFVNTPSDKIKQVYDTVVTGTALVSKHVLEAMAAQGAGQIVSILDVATESELPTYSEPRPYSVDFASKLAKARFTDVLRREARESGVTVSSFFLNWVVSDIDIDDDTKAPEGATHPRDAVILMQQVIEQKLEKVDLPPSN